MTLSRAVLVALLALTLTACASSVTGTPTPAPDLAGHTTEVTADAAPGGLRIPAIGVDVDQLAPLGLAANGQPEVPSEDTPGVAGWYVLGPQPGDPGAAVVLGHVGARGVAGVFARLHELQPGDRIEVDHGGTPVTFEVYDRGQYDKQAFPTDRIYRATPPGPELYLITCGGALNTAEHSFEDNIIIYARRA